MIEAVRNLMFVLFSALFLFGGCPKPKPKPTPIPEPTATPKVVQFEHLLLRQESGKLLRAGQPHDLFGFIPCWDGEEVDHMGWPGISDEGMDYALGFGANAFHIRLGPTLPDNQWANGLNYQIGPYNADGTFNDDWWARVRHIVQRAGEKGANVEVDLIDGWVCKHSQWGEFGMPWPQADIEACTNTLTETHRKFIRKAVEELGCFANVIWQDGNEVGVSGRYKPGWTFAIVDEVRRAEQELGCGVAHMFGTNSGNDEVEASPKIDYTATHNRSGIEGPHYGKWRVNNERNPFFSPEQEHQLYCAAKNSGQAWWFWRGGMSKEAMDQTLGLWKLGCGGVFDGCPFDVPPPTSIGCKPHGTWGGQELWDCTPLVRNFQYCRNAGFDRPQCPYRQEGDPFRGQCEERGMGGYPEFALVNATGTLALSVKGNNPLQFLLSGSGSGKVVCTTPRTGAANVCQREDREIEVSR